MSEPSNGSARRARLSRIGLWLSALAAALGVIAGPRPGAAQPVGKTTRTRRISGFYRGFGQDISPPVKLPIFKNAYCAYRVYDEPDGPGFLRDVEFNFQDRVVGMFNFSVSVRSDELPLKRGWKRPGTPNFRVDRQYDYNGRFLTDRKWEIQSGDVTERTVITLEVDPSLRKIRAARMTTRRKKGSAREETTNDIRCAF